VAPLRRSDRANKGQHSTRLIQTAMRADIVSAREKLLMRMGDGARTGGKGSMRRKRAVAMAASAPGYQPPHRVSIVDDKNMTVKQAMLKNSKFALKALHAEVRQFVRLGVVVFVKFASTRPLPSTVRFKVRADPNADWKARLVIGGHMVDPADVGETFSPTVAGEAVNLVLAVAADPAYKIHSVDVTGAFLHVVLKSKKPVYMKLRGEIAKAFNDLFPDQFPLDDKGEILVQVLKSIYGLPESSRSWNLDVTATLLSLGFVQLKYAPCIFLHRASGSLVALHVDDLLVAEKGDGVLILIMEACELPANPLSNQGMRSFI
jgi:hypothetical protein